METSDKIKQIDFSFFSPEEIKRQSVVEIKNPVAFDSLKNPCSEGLYDPLMGANPYDRLSKCPTCQKQEQNCPGHLGRIQLVFPVYNLYLTKTILKLMRAKCFYCNRITLPRKKQKYFQTLLKMVNLGLFSEFSDFERLSKINSNLISPLNLNNSEQKDKAETKDKRNKTEIGKPKDKKSEQKVNQKESELNKKLLSFLKSTFKSINDQLKNLKQQLENEKEKFDTNETSFRHFLKNSLIKEFFKDCFSNSKCSFCSESKPKISLEGNSKFYVTFKASEENENEPKTQLLNPLEIKKHLNSLFEINPKSMTVLFGKYETNSVIKENSKKGFIVKKFDPAFFFLEILPVTPNRFRPESRINNQSFLHSHTLMYTKILNLNSEIKVLVKEHKESLNENQNPETNENLNALEFLENEIEEEKSKQMEDRGENTKRKANRRQKSKGTKKVTPKSEILKEIFSKWTELQETINFLFDSSQTFKANEKESGIRQILEKKEGIFRMKIMGKRVNFAARSVISPDPNLETSEVGIPIFMAKKLTFPEPVNEHNIGFLRQLIINGPLIYPGAVAVEEKGVRKTLEGSSLEQRIAISRRLLEDGEKKIVFRQLMSGDYVLFNRQPTLHKNSLMSFRARVLPREQTIRMHYVNCAGFNADFDGDEMNVHLLQNYPARSEARHLSLADRQYILPTSKAPVRGFIQDFIVVALFISTKDVFFTRAEYAHLIYSALANVLEEKGTCSRIRISKPALIKPVRLWTGKQLFSNIIEFIADLDSESKMLGRKKQAEGVGPTGLNMKGKARVSPSYFCPVGTEESIIVVRNNQLLCGIFDKNQIGASSFGFMHCFFELYGHEKTGKLFSCFTRLCTTFLKLHGFTCGMSDLLTTEEFEERRAEVLKDCLQESISKQLEHFGIEPINFSDANLFLNTIANKSTNKKETSEENKKISNDKKNILDSNFAARQNSNGLKSLPNSIFTKNSEIILSIERAILETQNGSDELDALVKSGLVSGQSKLYSENVSTGLKVRFPLNNFSSMVLSGAKGSVLNQNLVSCNLGQQELEGKRAPVMSSGKTLPTFVPFDPNPRCGGFVADRFLTGLKAPEFFFHCMAGREGLIDTAVKTSRSGYLQRILVKNLESLAVEYDFTVRDVADKSLIQFYYGEDALNSMKVNVVENLEYLLDNFNGFRRQFASKEYELVFGSSANETKEFLRNRILAFDKTKKQEQTIQSQTLLEQFSPGKHFGAVSEKALKSLENFIATNKAKLKTRGISEDDFRHVFYFKYFDSLMSPGEAVGAVAAQSFGEPSTQMTLNTFHLAGHGGVNVTLGIPRLKELLTTKNTKSPVMFLPIKAETTEAEAKRLVRIFEQVNLLELVAKISCKSKLFVVENGRVLPAGERCRIVRIVIELEDKKAIESVFGINEEKLSKLLLENFVPKFFKVFKKLIGQNKKETNPPKFSKQRNSKKTSEGKFNIDAEDNNRAFDSSENFFQADDAEEHEAGPSINLQNSCLLKGQKFFMILRTDLNANQMSMTKFAKKTRRRCFETRNYPIGQRNPALSFSQTK